MSSPLNVARNESRTFRVSAFPSSRSLSPPTFYHFPVHPLYRLSNTYIRNRMDIHTPSNADRHHLLCHLRRVTTTATVVVIVIVIVLTMEILLFLATPMSLTRGVIPACVRI